MNLRATSAGLTQTVARYGLAVAAVALAWSVRESLSPVWAPAFVPFIFFYPAIVFAAWYGRLGPALLAIVLSTVASVWFFVAPHQGAPLNHPGVLSALLSFAAVGFCIAIAIEAMHHARARAVTALGERRRIEDIIAEGVRQQNALYRLVDRLHRADSLTDIYDAAFDAITAALRCDRASILLADDAGVMRFVSSRGLSESYMKAVDGHTPWGRDEKDPQPVCIEDVSCADLGDSLAAVVKREGIGALCFIPLMSSGAPIGKFMAYYDAPHVRSAEETHLALAIGRQLAFAIARKQTEDAVRESERRLAGLLHSAMDAIIAVDAQQRVVLFNPAAEQVFGCAASDALGSSLDRFMPQRFREAHREHIGNFGRVGITARRMGALGALSGLRDNGEEFPIEASISHTQVRGQKLFTVILRDITARRQVEQEREELLRREKGLRQSAEQANRLKDEFLATMSHELRNPLNVIVGYSELLLRCDEAKRSAQLRQIGEALKRNALAQSHLIRDLLDLSRLRSGKVTLNRETVLLMSAIENAVETVWAETLAKGIALKIDAPSEPLFVDGDLLRLEQIVWNLLNNAVKFTPAGGAISIRVSADAEEVVLVVEDTGQGIDPAFLPYAFDMFRQADANASRAQSGMGIGLALVQQLTELHGGSVAAYSAGENRGACFTVRLPASREQILPAPPLADVTAAALDHMRLLVVDDSEDTTDMLRRLLEMEGAIVFTASNAADALRIAGENEFDAIVSDICMPGIDGFEFLRRLRALPRAAEVPVLALTGYARSEDATRAEREGFYSHLSKPLDTKAVVETLLNISRRTGEKKLRASGR